MDKLSYGLVRKAISEKEYLIAVAKFEENKTNKEIMEEFNIAKSTLKSKLKGIKKKLEDMAIFI